MDKIADILTVEHATLLFRSGDVECVRHFKQLGTLVSDIFKECLDFSYGNYLDDMITRCLGLFRLPEVGTPGQLNYCQAETDVEYRARAKCYAAFLDVSENSYPLSKQCVHYYQSYHGLFENYEFCIHCNEKKGN
jgi:hypothetical protein